MAHPWVLVDPDKNFLYGDNQVGPEKKNAKLFPTEDDAERERRSHGSLPNFRPTKREEAIERDSNPPD